MEAKRKWILIMDDDKSVREMVKDVVRSMISADDGLKVESFASRQAVGEFIFNRIVNGGEDLGLLITDNSTSEGPDMGWQLADLVFSSSDPGIKNTQVLIMSGVAGEEEKIFKNKSRETFTKFPSRFLSTLKPDIFKAVEEAVRKVRPSAVAV